MGSFSIDLSVEGHMYKGAGLVNMVRVLLGSLYVYSLLPDLLFTYHIRSANALMRNYVCWYCCPFQATYSSDEPSETCSKISLVDLAGR